MVGLNIPAKKVVSVRSKKQRMAAEQEKRKRARISTPDWDHPRQRVYLSVAGNSIRLFQKVITPVVKVAVSLRATKRIPKGMRHPKEDEEGQ